MKIPVKDHLKDQKCDSFRILEEESIGQWSKAATTPGSYYPLPPCLLSPSLPLPACLSPLRLSTSASYLLAGRCRRQQSSSPPPERRRPSASGIPPTVAEAGGNSRWRATTGQLALVGCTSTTVPNATSSSNRRQFKEPMC